MTDSIFPYLPKELIAQALQASPGNEIESGKFDSPESSAALAVNTFGFFLERPADLPPLSGTETNGWPARVVAIEKCVRFPWRGGKHPWLDAYAETGTHMIGIESKRYEPFRGPSNKTFSDAYRRRVWGEHMGPFEKLRDQLAKRKVEFHHLDAVQLVKHAFGLRTHASKNSKQAILLYLYAEPSSWPNGKIIPEVRIQKHREEVALFGEFVRHAEVDYKHLTYKQLLSTLEESENEEVRRHAQNISERFHPL